MTGTRRAALAGLLAASTALVGCSAPTRYGNSPSGVAMSYFHQLYNRDFTAACALFTDQLRTRLGDCPGAVRRLVDGLSGGDRAELRDVSVRSTIPTHDGTAHVHTQDTRISATLAPRNVKGTPKPRSTMAHSFAAFHVTNGKGLDLATVGGDWRISGCGL